MPGGIRKFLKLLVILLLLAGVIYAVPFGVWIVKLGVDEKRAADDLQKVLVSEDWLQEQDENIGVAFTYPATWKVRSWKEGSDFAEEFGVEVRDAKGTSFSFYKNPGRSYIEGLLGDQKLLQEKRKINGAEFTVLHQRDDLSVGLDAGRYIISKDKDLLTEAVYGPDENKRVLAKIFSRITESIKPL